MSQPYQILMRKASTAFQTVDIETLKSRCSTVINSQRTLSRITNVSDLFYVLDEQNAIDEQHVSLLYNLLPENCNQELTALKELINNYRILGYEGERSCGVCNVMQNPMEELGQRIGELRLNDNAAAPMIQGHNDRIMHPDEDHALFAAFQYVELGIGNNWKTVGRGLKLTSQQLDVIDSENKKVREKIAAMLQQWQENVGEEATVNNLITALESRYVSLNNIAYALRQGKHL